MSMAAKTGRRMQTSANFWMAPSPSPRSRAFPLRSSHYLDGLAADQVAGMHDHRLAGGDAVQHLDQLPGAAAGLHLAPAGPAPLPPDPPPAAAHRDHPPAR